MPIPSPDGSFFSSRPEAISNTLSELCVLRSLAPRSTNFATITRLSGLKLRLVGLDRLPGILNDSTSRPVVTSMTRKGRVRRPPPNPMTPFL